MVNKISLFLYMILGFSALVNAAQDANVHKSVYTPLQIWAIDKLTSEKVNLNGDKYSLIIDKPFDKVQYLKEPLTIPFISITKYLNEYAESANGRCYIPKNALILNMGTEKTFGIWENEVGIMLSPDSKTVDSKGLRKLLNNVNSKDPKNQKSIACALKLLLLINKQGDIALSNLETMLS